MGKSVSFTTTERELTVLRLAIEEEADLWSRLAQRDSDHGEKEVQAACQRLAHEYCALLQKLEAAQGGGSGS